MEQLTAAFRSSDSIERVNLSYDSASGEIVAAGYYEEVRVPLGLFLRTFDISTDACRRALAEDI
jgi:hypothetical protein